MLQLQDIRKAYTTGGFTQVALDDVSVTFRDNEFVAILGPSGSGKTTLLNIIGGLDHADSGELVIDGTSTGEYQDRDWDTYRNNRIGFVFQSYNLIPHQSVLANVELALTLSGVGKAERRRRARAALDEVGLGDHVHKLPNQLSGGQMQRVAIARALVNNPEIVLADEPTGALDTSTSAQVMDLLESIAADRLVIMVTHNPELAERYATRTVFLRDGAVASDSAPFAPRTTPDAARSVRRARMSWLTALALSFSNLMTKKGRTFSTSLAGSIGIIGIACILALANGVNAYIKGVEQDTLSLYPLEIYSTGIDIGSMLSNGSNQANADQSRPQGEVVERKVLANMFGGMRKNDLASLKAYLESGKTNVKDLTNVIAYEYPVTPLIYAADTSRKVRQVNPNAAFSKLGLSSENSSNSLVSLGLSTDVFTQLVDAPEMLAEQFDVVAGHWPQEPTDLTLVLNANGAISDLMLYVLGLRDPAELDAMVEKMADNEEVTPPEGKLSFSYSQLLDAEFKLVPAAQRYVWDDSLQVWSDVAGDDAKLKALVDGGMTLRVAGIIQPKPGVTNTSQLPGLAYSAALVTELMDSAANAPIVQQQLADKELNVITQKRFDDESGDSAFNFEDIFEVDEEAMKEALGLGAFEDLQGMDLSKLSDLGSMGKIDLSALSGIDLSGLDKVDWSALQNLDLSALSDLDLSALESLDLSSLTQIEENLSELQQLLLAAPQLDVSELAGLVAVSGIPGLVDALAADPPTQADVAAISAKILRNYLDECEAAGITDPAAQAAGFAAYVQRADVQAELRAQASELLHIDQLADPDDPAVAALVTQVVDSMTTQLTVIAAYYTQVATTAIGQLESLAATLQQLQAAAAALSQLGPALEQLQNLGPALQSLAELGPALQQLEKLGPAMAQLQELGKAMEKLAPAMAQLEGLGDALSGLADGGNFDPEKLKEAFTFDMTEDDLTAMMQSLMSNSSNTYENNLRKLGYADPADPSGIAIYPKDFEAKQAVVDILNAYNAEQERIGHDDKVIVFTDIVGTLMASVTDIIDKISAVLVAFVSISLIVSSIMIGIITFISVLERKKEIGILRAMGASKRDIANVFNAETIIVGLAAGLLGITITMALTVVANPIVEANFDVPNIAILPVQAGLALIGVSVALTFIAGLIPSSAAARRDPVEALRSE
ncbi:MAG: ATP-binding cassette domain-containing protein [Propionibacteriaceae bacterium]|nr:ATP-binding cassette domain-containing protein [Propionibacteriaceae bacterium]